MYGRPVTHSDVRPDAANQVLSLTLFIIFLQKALYLVRSTDVSYSKDRKVPRGFKLKNDDFFLLLKNELLELFVLLKKL